MRTSSIDYHDDEITRISQSHLVMKFTHELSSHFMTHHPIKVPLPGTHSSIGIDKFPLIAVEHDGPAALRRPASLGLGHSSKSSFILKHQANPSAFDLVGCQQGIQR